MYHLLIVGPGETGWGASELRNKTKRSKWWKGDFAAAKGVILGEDEDAMYDIYYMWAFVCHPGAVDLILLGCVLSSLLEQLTSLHSNIHLTTTRVLCRKVPLMTT